MVAGDRAGDMVASMKARSKRPRARRTAAATSATAPPISLMRFAMADGLAPAKRLDSHHTAATAAMP